jgi:hypothetical protein
LGIVFSARFVGGGKCLSEEDECGCGCESEAESECKSTAPRVTIPEPEMTKDKKFKCPIDQEVYDNRKDYESHCKEEHDVL